LPAGSPYSMAHEAVVRHDPDCAINTPPYFPTQCNCGAIK
jgi:hypothetical protein